MVKSLAHHQLNLGPYRNMPTENASRRPRCRRAPAKLGFRELHAPDGTFCHGQMHHSEYHGRVCDEGLRQTTRLCNLAHDQV